MSGHSRTVGSYVAILLILMILTVLTVAVSFIPLAPGWHVAAGIGIGLIKGSLVVLFFMHAANSPRVTWCAIMAAVLWVLILFTLTFADYRTRGAIQSIPGH